MVKKDVMFVNYLLSGMAHTALVVECVYEQDQNSQKINKDVQYKLKIRLEMHYNGISIYFNKM